VGVPPLDRASDTARAGLCATCLQARRVETAKNSAFYLCQRSVTDPAFPKYPRLPVIQCTGYTAQAD
jgi:hypothetical protein